MVDQSKNLIQRLDLSSNITKVFLVVVLASLIAGFGTGYFLVSGSNGTSKLPVISKTPKTALQDTRTFRDFAEGKIQKRPEPKDPTEYIEGTHFLIRDGAQSVALTSSVVDLTQYEGKEVKVFGETQKAIKEGWLMDVGKVEEK